MQQQAEGLTISAGSSPMPHHAYTPPPFDVPNFIILGAAKAGTTALYHYLQQHPEIYMSPMKETNFFALKDEPLDFQGPGDGDYINRFSITSLEEYEDQFDGRTDEKAIGEASPLYLYSRKAPLCIHEYVPHAKLIVILRNPIDRAYSAFLHLVRDGRETTTDFHEALRQEEARIHAGWEHIWHYKHMGLYYEQLRRYYDLFDHSQIKVYLYRDFRTQAVGVLQELFGFLGVDDTFMPDTSVRHNATVSMPSHQKPRVPLEVRLELRDIFRDDILRLQDLIDRDLSHWLKVTSSEAELKSFVV
jgi:hypothetical protein